VPNSTSGSGSGTVGRGGTADDRRRCWGLEPVPVPEPALERFSDRPRLRVGLRPPSSFEFEREGAVAVIVVVMLLSGRMAKWMVEGLVGLVSVSGECDGGGVVVRVVVPVEAEADVPVGPWFANAIAKAGGVAGTPSARRSTKCARPGPPLRRRKIVSRFVYSWIVGCVG
jgi:hypothetical protein